METNNGGNAFPADPNWIESSTVAEAKRIAGGMTLRDYFAAKAMQAMISHRYKIGDFTNGDSAEEAYSVADAMLRARDA
jgi:hypothetical protein